MSYVDNVESSMHGAIGGVAGLAMLSLLATRGESRAVGYARANAAAAGARAGVLDTTVAQLRAQLAAARDEITSLQLERAQLRSSVRQLKGELDLVIDAAAEIAA